MLPLQLRKKISNAITSLL